MADEKKIETFCDERLSYFIAEWVKALESKTVDFFIAENPRKPVILSTEQSLEDAVKVLKNNNLKSAPVYGDRDALIGLLDMGSILKYSIRNKNVVSTLFGDDFWTKFSDLKYPDDMKVSKVSDVAYLARMKRFNTVDVNQTLLELGQKLRGTPAVGITDKGNLVSIVSQGHFVKAVNEQGWLKEQLVTLGDMIEAERCPTKIDTATDKLSTFEVFYEMARRNRSSIGVLEKDSGDFLGSLNLMDTTSFYELGDQEVETKVGKYLEQQKQNAIICSKETLLIDAMSKICSKRSNRIWVIEDKKAVAVCSLTDVLALVS